MRMRKIALISVCGAMLLSGCGTDRLSTREQEDDELSVGDLGVERYIYSSSVRSLQEMSNGKALLDPNGFPLVEQFPNESIKPIKGNYAENVIAEAKSFLGTPYEYGSDRTEPSTFDCSDFIRWAFLSSLGMNLPWDSRAQEAYVRAFAKRKFTKLSKASRGDILFFIRYLGDNASDYKGVNKAELPVSHVAIYLGNGKIIHSPSKKAGGVRIDSVKWRGLDHRFVFGGSILKEPKKEKKPAS